MKLQEFPYPLNMLNGTSAPSWAVKLLLHFDNSVRGEPDDDLVAMARGMMAELPAHERIVKARLKGRRAEFDLGNEEEALLATILYHVEVRDLLPQVLEV